MQLLQNSALKQTVQSCLQVQNMNIIGQMVLILKSTNGTNIKKPIKCSAPKYIDYLMTLVQDQLDDETLFPSKIGVPFPKNLCLWLR